MSSRARQWLSGVLVFAAVLGLGAWFIPRYGPEAKPAWEPGQLRNNGLRLQVTGRSDAGDVLNPASFEHPHSQKLYAIATKIPELLNQLYCWCGCIKQGKHRSALACYEDTSSLSCGVCQETARIAWQQVQAGQTNPAIIQQAIDREWALPPYHPSQDL